MTLVNLFRFFVPPSPSPSADLWSLSPPPPKHSRRYYMHPSWSTLKAFLLCTSKLINIAKENIHTHTHTHTHTHIKPLQSHLKFIFINCEEMISDSKFKSTQHSRHTTIPRLNWICRQQLGDFDIRLNIIPRLVVSLLPMLPLVRQFSLLEVKEPQPEPLTMILFLFLLARIKEMTIWSKTKGRELAFYCCVSVVTASGMEKDSPRKYCLSKQARRVINRRGFWQRWKIEKIIKI